MAAEFKSAAVLQLLNNHFYRKIFLVNGWQLLVSAASIHCDELVSVTDSCLTSRLSDMSDSDLIIALSPRNMQFMELLAKEISEGKEALLVWHSHISYNSEAVKNYLSVMGLNNRHAVGGGLKTVGRVSRKHARYMCFPDPLAPELILSSVDLRRYRRYWSWFNGRKGRHLSGLFFEYVLVRIFKSDAFAPFKILKCN